MEAKLYTVEEVADLASVTPRTIRNYLKAGRLEGRKIDGLWRFSGEAVQRLLSGEDMLRMENYTEPLLTIEDHFLDDDADKDFDLDSIYTLNYQQSDEQVYAPSERELENNYYSSNKLDSVPLNASGALGSPPLSPAHPAMASTRLDESFKMPQTGTLQGAGGVPYTPLPYTIQPPANDPSTGNPNLAGAQPNSSEAIFNAMQNPSMQPMPYGYPAYPGMQPMMQQPMQQVGMQQPVQQAGMQQPIQQAGMQQPVQQAGMQQPIQQAGMQQPMQMYSTAQGNSPASPNVSVFFAPTPTGHMQGGYADPYYPMGGYPLYPRSAMPPTGMYYPPPEQTPPPKPEAPKADAPLASSKLEANGVQYDLSDIGHKVALFAAEVHDCSDGPQMCTMMDLHQSLATAKITSERLTEIARQESENGPECTCYVEFDSRYYVARYTLFGSLDFLVRCQKLMG